ncbi:T9SS type A sorting domain-containing protein [Flavobacterium azooxidireducens]|uniref:T9SS type A sorting domain-containing protein n=1 Tax=Flavobacterium azooxidireducens TaxID=1871076 RepID=A0ABY4KDY3_9FLAO|nr:T9SS type A sorting domain-containing protein [Flavobacterium azooxidireducens]UPQ79011.1 T9SS type A sorting domain-containing protein [Flavobacterium azooxidireducens]
MKKITLIIFLFFLVKNFGQNNGSLDQSFGPYFSPTVSDKDDTLQDFLIDSQNYIVSVGRTYHQNAYDFALCSVNSNGNYNLNFGNDGIYHGTNVVGGNPNKIEKVANGYLAVGYYYPSFGSNLSFAIAKYLNNGVLDTSFANNGLLIDSMFNGSDNAVSAKELSNGKIVVMGTNVDSHVRVTMLMINNNGSIDTSFGSNGKKILNFPNNSRRYSISQMELVGTNKIIIAGNSTLNNTSVNEKDIFVAKLNIDGSFDSSFGVNGLSILNITNYSENVAELSFYDNGDFILTGTIYNDNDSNYSETVIAKFNSNGSLISGFGTNGIKILSLINSSNSLQEFVRTSIIDENFIYIGGSYRTTYSYYNYNGFVCKLDINGDFVTDFANQGILSFNNNIHRVVKIKFDNSNLVIGGINEYSDHDFIFTRVINSNTLDLDNLTNDSVINYYPNPVKEKLFVNLNSNDVKIIEVKIFDIDGRNVLIDNDILHESHEIDLSFLSRGQYILLLKTDNNLFYNVKILKD